MGQQKKQKNPIRPATHCQQQVIQQQQMMIKEKAVQQQFIQEIVMLL